MPSNIRAQAFKFIEKGVKLGLGSNEILTSLIDYKLGYRRSEMLNDVRILRGLPEKLNVFKNVNLEKLPSLGVMQLGGNFMKSLYRYDVQLEVQDENTLETSILERSVSSDVSLTRRQAAEAVVNNNIDKEKYPKRIVLKATTTMGFYRQDAIFQ